ncbi:probable ATP-dependent RNA helicase DDX52 isoform X2 [Hydra vulgaris]|uniref:Probable ATP-dependent RNA helicase DDX52 n=1 Tax=Hydra vulgaris TaxID=6087 RepID=A0ABM4CP82_HYDVU
MVDTYSLFKKLGSGASFDLKRFKTDAEKFKIISSSSSTIDKNDFIEELDFFGTKKDSKKDGNKTCFNETKTVIDDDVEKVKIEDINKKKKKKRKLPDDGITLLSCKNKKVKDKNVKSKEKANQQHIEKINIFRKEHLIHVYGFDIADPISSFLDLKERFNVPTIIMKNVKENGFEVPTPIQMQAIPVILQHREMLACAPTGSGKTLAFILPILFHLKESKKSGIRVVIVSPTRELSQQIYREFVRMNAGIGLKIDILTKAKISNFKSKACDILISTPNRLVHLLKQDFAPDLGIVEWLVLDEGDKLFEDGEAGFRGQVALIYQACSNPSIKRLLFSATLANSVEDWCKDHLDNVVRITVGNRNAATDTIDQELIFVGQESGKLLAIRQILHKGFQPPILVFVQSKDRAKELFNELVYDGLNVEVIHSDRTQAQRENIVKCFRTGKIWILIATDLMGRGIDFKGVNMVINYDFPSTTVSYIHRIGRTGRAGRRGKAITLFTEDDVVNLRSIANVVRSSGGEVPDWMLKLKKLDSRTKKTLRKVPLERPHINTVSKYDAEKRNKKKQMIEQSKEKKKEKENS